MTEAVDRAARDVADGAAHVGADVREALELARSRLSDHDAVAVENDAAAIGTLLWSSRRRRTSRRRPLGRCSRRCCPRRCSRRVLPPPDDEPALRRLVQAARAGAAVDGLPQATRNGTTAPAAAAPLSRARRSGDRGRARCGTRALIGLIGHRKAPGCRVSRCFEPKLPTRRDNLSVSPTTHSQQIHNVSSAGVTRQTGDPTRSRLATVGRLGAFRPRRFTATMADVDLSLGQKPLAAGTRRT